MLIKTLQMGFDEVVRTMALSVRSEEGVGRLLSMIGEEIKKLDSVQHD
jgi:hypothetical protein